VAASRRRRGGVEAGVGADLRGRRVSPRESVDIENQGERECLNFN
jgi:hypothetical protein